MRATLIVLDSVGVGAMPDAAEWGDAGADTLGHVAQAVGGLELPHLQRLGLGNIHEILGVPPVDQPAAGFGKAAIFSAGKDTISGHWEMAGVPVTEPFKTFPDGFPPIIIDTFCKMIGRGVLGNKAASGTVIIEELGPEHIATGEPIVYTSSDSVFQIAAHEDVVDVDTLYDWCEDAFRVVTQWGVARVIARPFVGEPGAFVRTGNRQDFAVRPPDRTLVDMLRAAGWQTTGVGKVKSIFGDRGFSDSVKASGNADITRAVLDQLDVQHKGLIFANLVDFDMLFGHRRNPQGYAEALMEFDRRVPLLMERMGRRDLLLFTADHGCDPTHPGTDHTREYVPILAWHRDGNGRAIGTRSTMADIGASIADWFELDERPAVGTSFLRQL
ncbi:MAG: phosphopentomutase [Alphaproteobacteria bacterium]|nr:phosphopentomutase [Alphaproteobacteria bacterium]